MHRPADPVERGSMPWQDGALSAAERRLWRAPEDLLEADIHSLEEVTDVSEKAGSSAGAMARAPRSATISRCASRRWPAIPIQHGFQPGRKKHHLSVRVIDKKDSWLLRFRDDCGAFDPVHYVPEGDQDALGIRLVRAMAREASYTYSLNLNNLALKLNAED